MDEIIILGIAVSLRKDAYSRLALKASQERVPDGTVLNLAELHRIPVFGQDTEMALLLPRSASHRTYGRLRW